MIIAVIMNECNNSRNGLGYDEHMEQHANDARQRRGYRKDEAGLHGFEAERRAFEIVVNGQAG